jgi:glycogen synthase
MGVSSAHIGRPRNSLLRTYKGIVQHGTEVLFVMPSASGDEDESAVKIINASDIAVTETSKNVRSVLEKVQFLRVGTNIVPYLTPEQFTEEVEKNRKGTG